MNSTKRGERRRESPEPARRRRDEQRREWERGQEPPHGPTEPSDRPVAQREDIDERK